MKKMYTDCLKSDKKYRHIIYIFTNVMTIFRNHYYIYYVGEVYTLKHSAEIVNN